MKKLRYLLEAMLLHIAFFIFHILPVAWASNVGGFLAKSIGPRLAASRKARRNLENALDNPSSEEIIQQMWENLGRTIAEYPNLAELGKNHTEVIGIENIKDLPEDKPIIFIAAHLGNWEIVPASLAAQYNITASSIYREPNNPWVADLLHKCRSQNGRLPTIPKSRRGARNMVRTLQGGGNLGILIDQKYNEGLAVPFFGRPAMTSPAFAQLAQKFDCPLIPVRSERLDGCNFRVTLYPVIKTAGRPTEDIMQDAHHILEGWIKERPGQWLWLHRRWDSAKLKDLNDE